MTSKQSKPPESLTEDRQTDVHSPTTKSDMEPRRKVTLAVRDCGRSSARYADASSEACISEPSYAARRYPAEVQLTTSVSSLEQLCPGIAHQLFDSPEDGETYSGEEGNLLPLVVWASPLDTPEDDASSHLFTSIGGEVEGSGMAIP